MTLRGKLIVLEGGDRCGKSTQAAHLLSSIPNSTLLKFPDRSTRIGKLLDEYLKFETNISHESVHLLFSANRWESKQKIESLIASGKTVIIDRYSHSGIVYSLVKGLSLEFCTACEKGLPKPDLILYFDCDPIVAAQRTEYGLEKFETLEFQSKVRHEFARFKNDFVVVDASKDLESVQKQVWEAVQEMQMISSDLQHFE